MLDGHLQLPGSLDGVRRDRFRFCRNRKPVQRALDAKTIRPHCHMHINLCCGDILEPEQLLNCPEVRARFQKMRRK